MTESTHSEIRDGMRIEWDVPIAMDDGLVLRADVFRPTVDRLYPVILSYGPYAKGLALQEGYPSAWQRMVAEHPDVACGSTKKYQSWVWGASRRRAMADLHRRARGLSHRAERARPRLRIRKIDGRAAVDFQERVARMRTIFAR